MEQILHAEILATFPPVDEQAVDALLQQEIAADDTKFIVLDDDPTGVQTVHDISVYTDWSVESIKSGLLEEQKVFYILTNSRGMTAAETTAAHREIAGNIVAAARETGKKYLIMSRSDSTLRGHYPLETEVLREGMAVGGLHVDGEIMCPFFKAGGRFTIGNVHYVQQGDRLVPAAQTEFARDKTFGYTRSALPDYIEEKTAGRFKADSVTCISLDELRRQNELYRDYLELKEQNPDYRFADARVVAMDPADNYCNFTINRGTLADVAVGNPVITPDGLVGVVYEVSASYAKVRTILDPGAPVSVYVSRTRDNGITGNTPALAAEGRLRLERLDRTAGAAAGDILVTYGNGKYPAGLLVGELTEVYAESDGLSLSATVKPFADIARVSDVFVIVDFTGRTDEE